MSEIVFLPTDLALDLCLEMLAKSLVKDIIENLLIFPSVECSILEDQYLIDERLVKPCKQQSYLLGRVLIKEPTLLALLSKDQAHIFLIGEINVSNS